MAPQRNTGAGAEAELPEYAGHYRLESSLGSGGMGVVHLARSTSGMKVAVKIVHAQFARDPEFRGRFRQEVAAARRVSGAFTASVVDADPEAERPWMATLFIPGPTLSDHVKRNGPMDPAQLRRLMAGLAEALRDIHRVGVVHRDLKPSNVLLADDGPKVIDFGISRPKDSELRTETGKLIGTPPFMAPEQFRRPREVGPAADIFALGSVMVHAATGRGPFDSDSPYVVAYQVVHDEPDLTGVPESLAPLVLRCLAKEPEDRPTPDELMRALRSVAASYDTQAFIPAQRAGDAPESGSAPPHPRPRRRPGRKTAIAAVAGVIVLAGVLASVRLLGGGGTTPEGGDSPTASVSRFTGWEANPVPEGVGAAQCSYGGRQLICARPGVVFGLDPADGRVLWRHPVATSSVSKPPVLAGGLVQPMAEEGRRLEALDPTSGKARWQRKLPAHNAMQVAGRTILLTGIDGTVNAVDASTGDPKWSHRIPGHPLPSFASFTEDPLVYATNPSVDASKTRVTAVDPATGAVRWDLRLDGKLTLIGVDGGSLFFLATDKVYDDTDAVVRYTPSTKSTRRVALPVGRADVQAAVRGNVVYLLGSGGSLEAVDMTARKRLWHLETAVSRGSVPVSNGTHVFFVAPDGRLLAVDAHDGDLVGQTPVRMNAASGRVAGALPGPLLAHDHLYATAPDGTVFAVDARDPAAW
ncbi:serine/threonine-protein kinase [Streptomyces justiciae]|uniref:Serine/threonine-protein kinase n=1 Tax=Streptomyces justiciae TaxID=2780140 RepID=A0ABU3M1B0_9ACTN|nr:serine/threonine-protein kinase [Streptomyces justiciae]MDT7845168.1 serine/threonine-protein kinase [Streptomyces justiciae]